MRKYLCLSALLLSSVSASDHPKLSGTWLLDAAHSHMQETKLKSETLKITQDEDMVAIDDDSNTGGKDRKEDYHCLADGSTCKAKDVSVSLYYNGPMLVVLETRRNNQLVIKKRLTTSDDGKTLSMEIIHVSPGGPKDETLTFVKQ
jgi:hypothetical protein